MTTETRPQRVGTQPDGSNGRFEEELRRREAILEAVTFAADCFLSTTTVWEECVQEVLARLGRAADVSRVYVFENIRDLYATQRYEWAAPGVISRIDSPLLQALPYTASNGLNWGQDLREGRMRIGYARDASAQLRAEHVSEDLYACVVVPIFVEGAWWGYIGFDECARERDFSPMELDALRAAANTLGAAIGRNRADQSSALLAAIVASTDDAIIGMAPDGVIASWNPGAERLFGYPADVAVGQSIAILLPPDALALMPAALADLAEGTRYDHYETERLRQDGSRVAVSVAISPIHAADGTLLGTSSIYRDITERKRAEEELRESQRVHATLLSNLPGMAYRCRNDPAWTMTFVSDGCRDLTGYPATDLLGNHRFAYADLIHSDDRDEVWRDVQGAIAADEPFRLTYRITTAAGVQKWVLEQGRGVRDLDGTVQAIEGFITDVTDRVQARQLLEQRVAERTRELATLLDVSSTVASTLELEPLLGLILDQLRVVIEYSGAVILTLDGDELEILRARSSTGALSADAQQGMRFPSNNAGTLWDLIRRGQPVIIDDIRDGSALARAYQDFTGAHFEAFARTIRSWLGVPLAHKDRILGMVAFAYREPGFYTKHHADLAMALAGQAALAIENARLYQQAQGTAALEERQRLARELHDSVSQALYGIGLGAAAVRSWLDTDPKQAIEPADYVLSLAEAGLAEMRALIFELRPESLAEEGLIAALEKQADSLRARHGLVVTADLGAEPELLLEAKEVFYRIAQEALHNIVKHAQASRVEVRLAATTTTTPADIELIIADDGRGFDPGGGFPGHLGLRSMRERIERLGGTFSIESAPGNGTRIRASLRRP